jgi:hypothetical protein
MTILGLLIEMKVLLAFSLKLALNQESSILCLQISWDYRCESQNWPNLDFFCARNHKTDEIFFFLDDGLEELCKIKVKNLLSFTYKGLLHSL